MRRAILLAFALILLLAACVSKALSAEEILAQSASTMSEVETLQFSIEHQGDPAVIELGPGMSVTLLGAGGAYQAPDSAYATVKVELSGMVGEANVLWLPDGAYFKLPPLIAAYQPVDLGDFDISNIFSGEGSISTVMTNLIDPVLVGEENLEGTNTYHIQGEADGNLLKDLVAGAIQPASATLDIWIDKATMEVVRVVATESETGVWQIDFFAYGDPVEIPTP
jgi:hypothetical protein